MKQLAPRMIPDQSTPSTPAAGNIVVFSNAGKLKQVDSSGVVTDLTLVGGGGGLLPWTVVTGATGTAVSGNGYILNNAGVVTVTLPSTSAVGDVIKLAGMGAGGWALAQLASQIIHFGNLDSTTGTGGSLASTNLRDVVEILCVVANLEWQVVDSIGNITVV